MINKKAQNIIKLYLSERNIVLFKESDNDKGLNWRLG